MAGNSRVEIRLPEPLKQWAADYARKNNTTVSALVVRFFTRLKAAEDTKQAEDRGRR